LVANIEPASPASLFTPSAEDVYTNITARSKDDRAKLEIGESLASTRWDKQMIGVCCTLPLRCATREKSFE
jgi:hypothetical protein